MNNIPKYFKDCKHLNMETYTPYKTRIILTNYSSCGKELSREYLEITQ